MDNQPELGRGAKASVTDSRESTERTLDETRQIVAEWYEGREPTYEELLMEMSDYIFLLNQIPTIYMAVTSGRMSKTNYFASTVIREFEDAQTEHVTGVITDCLDDYLPAPVDVRNLRDAASNGETLSHDDVESLAQGVLDLAENYTSTDSAWRELESD